MLNRDIFVRDPVAEPIPNNGVASVTSASTEEEQKTLRYELTHFVCQGQYNDGLCRILRSYMGALEREGEQMGVWVSGFYGSGKSHMVKILQYLWTDQKLSDGTPARNLVGSLTPDVQALLKELSTCAVRHGGVHAAAGTLGSQTSLDVPLAVLQILLRSLNIPEHLSAAELYLYLHEEGTLQAVDSYLQERGKDLNHEMQNMYVSGPLRDALTAVSPSFDLEPKEVSQSLRAQYPPNRAHLSVNEMVSLMKSALMLNGELPLTLLVLDELQQFIGENNDRSYQVQEITEACASQFSAKLLLVATGQSAITNTGSLQRLAARFPTQISLSDTDVDAVTRAIVLRKKPDKLAEVERLVDECSGEIFQQLQGTAVAHTTQDRQTLAQDYPILPARRRFWERVLRAVDSTGTSSMLRAQLRIVQDALANVADEQLGHVVAADALYNQISPAMEQSGALLLEERTVIEKHLKENGEYSKLKSRLCALIFLIGKLERDGGAQNSIRATSDVLADLLVEDLRAGGSELRRIVPDVLQELVLSNDLMQVDGTYRIQTRETSEWKRDMDERARKLKADAAQLRERRNEILKAALDQTVKKVSVTQGVSKEKRNVVLSQEDATPPVGGSAIVIWARDGWWVTRKAVEDDAKEAGVNDPVVRLFVPEDRGVLDQKIALMDAANETVKVRATPTTEEGRIARSSMQQQAVALKEELDGLVRELLDDAVVFLGGGKQEDGVTLHERLRTACTAAAQRLFPKFATADKSNWNKVIEHAKKGDSSPMSAVGEQGEAAKTLVGRTVLDFIGIGKKGNAVRKHFAGPPYGWPQDGVDACLAALTAETALQVTHASKPVSTTDLNQSIIGDCEFRVEKFQLAPSQLIELRGLFSALEIKCKAGEEVVRATQFLGQARSCADSAGGEPPAPERSLPSYFDELQGLTGTELLSALHNHVDDLKRDIAHWKKTAQLLQTRRVNWEAVQELLEVSRGLPGLDEFTNQSDAIRVGRQLLNDPEPVSPLLIVLEQALRAAIGNVQRRALEIYYEEMRKLEAADAWEKLTHSQWKEILDEAGVKMPREDPLESYENILSSLKERNLDAWEGEVAALPARFAKAQRLAAKRLEPNSVEVILPRPVLKTAADVDEYLGSVRQMILAAIENHPVQVV